MSEAAQELARQISHKLWEKYDDTFGYRTEKQEANAEFGNMGYHPDNIWSFWGQFDSDNHQRFAIEAAIAVAEDKPGADELFNWVTAELERENASRAELREKYGIDL